MSAMERRWGVSAWRDWNDKDAEIAALKRQVEVLALASRNMIEAWDNKTPLAWQPENNPELLKKLRSALLSVDEAKKGGA